MGKYKKWRKSAGIIVMCIVLGICAVPVYAAPDWSQITETETGGSQVNAQKVQCAYDEKNLYLRITGKESNTWDSLPKLQVKINQKPVKGDVSTLTLTCDKIPEEGEAAVAVRDIQWKEHATGKLTRANRVNTIEFTLPLLALGYKGEDVSAVAVVVVGSEAGECAGEFIGDKEEQPTEPEKPAEPEQPEGIVVDGKFSDWDSYDLTYVDENGINMAAMTCDGMNLYVRIIEEGSYDFSFPWREVTLGFITNMGKRLWLGGKIKGEAENAELTFRGIEGAYGRCGKVNGVYNWEISIPMTEIWSGVTYVSEISMVSYQKPTQPIVTVSNPAYIDRGEQGGDLEVTGDIAIDGYYKDWDSIPHTEITYQNKDRANNHIGALYLGEKYLYGHYKLNRLFTKYLKADYMEIKINGKRFELRVLPVDSSGNIQDDRRDEVPNLGKGIYTEYGVFLSGVPNAPTYYNNVNGQVALTIYEVPRTEQTLGDEIEFSMSYERLEELTGIKREEIRKVELYNPYIGDEWLICAGTSSGPWLGIGISITAALGLYYILGRKSKKKEETV